MADQPLVRRRPIEHREPTAATIKQLYGTAYQCAEPSCALPLYRINPDNGEWILNSSASS